MKTFEDFRRPIVIKKEYTVVRDGGSHMHTCISHKNCIVKQDFALHSKTRGRWFINQPPPFHTEWTEIDFNRIAFDK